MHMKDSPSECRTPTKKIYGKSVIRERPHMTGHASFNIINFKLIFLIPA